LEKKVNEWKRGKAQQDEKRTQIGKVNGGSCSTTAGRGKLRIKLEAQKTKDTSVQEEKPFNKKHKERILSERRRTEEDIKRREARRRRDEKSALT